MSATLTIAAALLAAWVLGRLARALGLPGMVGMLAGGALVGAGLGPWLDGVTLPGAGLAVEGVARPVRLGALALVLLRAGLGLSLGDLRRGGPLALRLGLLPVAADALCVALAAHLLLSLSPMVAMVLGCAVAATSPAIVIPGLLRLLDRGPDGRRRILTALLAGTPVDNLAAVVLLGLTLDLALGEGAGPFPALGGLAADIGGGLLLGLAGGWVAARVLPATHRLAAVAAWALAGLLVWLGELAGVSIVLAVLAAGMVLRGRRSRGRESLEIGLARLWGGAQILLFGLVGLSVDLGALRHVGLALVAIIGLGQLGRLAGSWAATARSGLDRRDRTLAAVAYLPKATIQAAFGGLALDRGLAEGDLILSASVLAIVLCAPLGAMALGAHGAHYPSLLFYPARRGAVRARPETMHRGNRPWRRHPRHPRR